MADAARGQFTGHVGENQEYGRKFWLNPEPDFRSRISPYSESKPSNKTVSLNPKNALGALKKK